MTTRFIPRTALLALLLVGGALGCTENKVRTVIGCQNDSECGDAAHWRCETSDGTCRCRDDLACARGEFCNPAQFCQTRVTCYTNADCGSGQTCDFDANVCIPKGRCTRDEQCALGTLCNRQLGSCQPGCHSFGDCALGNACLCKLADGGPTECSCPLEGEARTACEVGRCTNEACPNTDACPYGQVCRQAEGAALKTCQSPYDPDEAPYCDACTYGPGGQVCGSGGPNFCLADVGNFSSFCGVDCSDGNQCPKGYNCSDVVVVRSIGCGNDRDCPINSVSCRGDSDCPNSGLCQMSAGAATGFCSGRCYKHEGESRGFCTCNIDSECAQETCLTTTRRCSITQRACNPALPQPCAPIRCVEFRGAGGCLIGQNCAPEEGLDCADVRP